MVCINIHDEHSVLKTHTQTNNWENKCTESTAHVPRDTLVQTDGGAGQPH